MGISFIVSYKTLMFDNHVPRCQCYCYDLGTTCGWQLQKKTVFGNKILWLPGNRHIDSQIKINILNITVFQWGLDKISYFISTYLVFETNNSSFIWKYKIGKNTRKPSTMRWKQSQGCCSLSNNSSFNYKIYQNVIMNCVKWTKWKKSANVYKWRTRQLQASVVYQELSAIIWSTSCNVHT